MERRGGWESRCRGLFGPGMTRKRVWLGGEENKRPVYVCVWVCVYLYQWRTSEKGSVFIVIPSCGNECNHKRIKNLWVSLDAGNGGNGFRRDRRWRTEIRPESRDLWFLPFVRRHSRRVSQCSSFYFPPTGDRRRTEHTWLLII